MILKALLLAMLDVTNKIDLLLFYGKELLLETMKVMDVHGHSLGLNEHGKGIGLRAFGAFGVALAMLDGKNETCFLAFRYCQHLLCGGLVSG